MKIIETTFERLPRERLVIGFEGENLRATVRIDCSSVFAEYPNATPTLIVKPLFADAYPVVVDRNGTDVDWLITSEILSFTGDGEIQLVFYKDQVICKSAVSKIRVSRSLTVTGDMPDPVVQWIESANRKLAEVDAQIVELEGMVDTATDAATRAEQSASTASTAATNAATSAATASTKAAEAQASANTATAKASEAALSATQARNSAVSAADSERIATAKAVEATTAAGTATTKAEQATDAAQTATEKAGDASASATAAQTSATNAASSATAASASETAAKASETAASTSASQAAQSAQGASADAQTATQKAAEATQSATNAAASATSAATSAETASTKAGEAAQSAQAVAETAEQLADSLEQIDQNTQDIAELDERKANIDGYYPDMTVGNAEQLNSSKFVENSEPYTFRTSGSTSDIGNREYVDAVVGGTLAWNQAVRDEASQNETDFAPIVTVTDAVEDAAGVKVKLEPVQDLHGYDHPWPAGGGKNLISVAEITRTDTIRIFDYEADTLVDTVTLSFYCNNAVFSNTSGAFVYFRKNDDSNAALRTATSISKVNGDSITAGTAYTGRIYVTLTNIEFRYVLIWGGILESGTLTDLQMELNTLTDFAPYSNICPITGWDGVQIVVSPTTDAEDGQTYSITLPTEAGTVYGGELTVNADGSGSLVVDRAHALLNDSDKWIDSGTTTITFQYNQEFSDRRRYDGSFEGLMCTYYPVSASLSNTARWRGAASYYFGFKTNSLTLEQIKADAATGKIAICYVLNTSLTYTLTPTEIRTLLGTNNIWADTGDVALTYTGTDEHLTLESGKKYLSRISGTDSMLLGSGQEITAAKGTDNVFDLTKMFGTAVADYVYGQGAGFFRKWFPKPLYSYNAGELLSVEGLSAHEMVGFNQWDEEWEVGAYSSADGAKVTLGDRIRSKNKIQVLPETMYAGKIGLQLYFYDADYNYLSWTTISTGTFRTPTDAKYVTFNEKANSGTTYKHDICINLSHSGARNGEYEPYTKHSYPLDSSVILRGIPKVGANGVYWDGDRYLPDGTVERRYREVKGQFVCSGAYRNQLGVWCCSFRLSMELSATSKKATPISDRFTSFPNKSYNNIDTDGIVKPLDLTWTGIIALTDATSGLSASSTAEEVQLAFTNYVNAHEPTFVYELATPTTETAQPYHSTQWVNDWGTEEFVSTSIVPVGTETRYPANLRDKLQHLPDAASGNGSYLITQTDGQMVLTPFPAPPSTAGNYVLKATVTGGVATYTWEVAT